MKALRAALGLVPLIALSLPARASPGPQPLPMPPPIPAPRDEAYPGTMKITVDATDLDRRILRVHEEIPVSGAGDFILLYPQWLPGTHAPEGTLDAMAGLTVTIGGKRVEWMRDVVDVHAFHIPVPAGAKTVGVDFQYLSPVSPAVGRREVSGNLIALDWDSVVMYPAGYFTRQIPAEVTIKLPDGWQFGCAMEVASTKGSTTTFKVLPVETVIDSPLRAGRYHKRYDLTPAGDKTPVALDLLADRADLVELKPAIVDFHKQLVVQSYKLFGAKHFDHYNFLIQLSEEIGGNTTLEHHRSATYGMPLNSFEEWEQTAGGRDVIAHEYTHSFDGKFRRPADLWTPNYNVPMRNSLLWVYEGGTEYWGQVLAARSGMWSRQQALDALAMMMAFLDTESGRSWRSVQDTTNDEIINPRRPMSWHNWQRFEEYYTEGALIWLDADTLIREKTGNKKSLDDFTRAFFGIQDGSYTPAVYTFDDIVKTLNDVLPMDWATFLRKRLDGHGPGAPLDGLKRGGYKLVYTDTPSEYWKSSNEEGRRKTVDESYSLGFIVNPEGVLNAVRWDSPASKAGVISGSKLVAVDGVAYEADRLRDAIKRAKGGKTPIELLLQTGNRYHTVRIDYHDGLRYPHLEREGSGPAYLDDILAPR